MLTKQQMLAALDGLIDGAEHLHAKFVTDFVSWKSDFVVWLKASESTVEAIFGPASDALSSFKNIYFVPPPWEQAVFVLFVTFVVNLPLLANGYETCFHLPPRW